MSSRKKGGEPPLDPPGRTGGEPPEPPPCGVRWCGGVVVIKIISSFIVISNYCISCSACCTSGRRGVGG